jgi:hypothetical protein
VNQTVNDAPKKGAGGCAAARKFALILIAISAVWSSASGRFDLKTVSAEP